MHEGHPFPKLHQRCSPMGTASAGMMCKGCGGTPGCSGDANRTSINPAPGAFLSPAHHQIGQGPSPFHPHKNGKQFQESQFVLMAHLTRKWQEMSSFGLLENGTLFQNACICLIVEMKTL